MAIPAEIPRGFEARISYPALRRRLVQATIAYAFSRGSGGPLAFLWALGCGAFSIPFELPLLTLPWTALALAIGASMVRSYLRDIDVQDQLVRELVEREFPPPRVLSEALRRHLTRGHQLAAEIAAKALVNQMRSRRGSLFGQLIGQAGEMLAMQYESARQAEELLRILDIAGRAATSAGSLLVVNRQAIEHEASQAEALVGGIAEQLETLLLQLIQLGAQGIDPIRGAEFGREARDALERLQAEVGMRQSVAERVIAELTGNQQPI